MKNSIGENGENKKFYKRKMYTKPKKKKKKRGRIYSILVCQKYSRVNPPIPDHQRAVYTISPYALPFYMELWEASLKTSLQHHSGRLSHSLFLTPLESCLV